MTLTMREAKNGKLGSRTAWGLTVVLAAVAVVVPSNALAGQGDAKTILFEKDIALSSGNIA